jgi:hypothetical protein
MKLYVAYDLVRGEIIGEYGSEQERADAVFNHYSHSFSDPFELGMAIIENTHYFETTEQELGEL